MRRWRQHIISFLRHKLQADPRWRDLTIVFSGHDVPGEGELLQLTSRNNVPAAVHRVVAQRMTKKIQTSQSLKFYSLDMKLSMACF